MQLYHEVSPITTSSTMKNENYFTQQNIQVNQLTEISNATRSHTSVEIAQNQRTNVVQPTISYT